jgi:hypothetical protein
VVLRERLHKSNDDMSYIHGTDGPAERRGLLVWSESDAGR